MNIRIGTVKFNAGDAGFSLGIKGAKAARMNAGQATRLIVEARGNDVVQLIISYSNDEVYRQLDLQALRDDLSAVLNSMAVAGESYDVSPATRNTLVEQTVTVNLCRLTGKMKLEFVTEQECM